MGKAGKALKQVLETYSISQNRLAVVMGVGRSNVHRWVYEVADPVGDAILEIRKGLQRAICKIGMLPSQIYSLSALLAKCYEYN